MAGLSTHDRPRLRPRLWLAIILLLALVVASLMARNGFVRFYQLHRAKAALEQEIEQLAASNAALAEEVRALRTDPSRVEAIAREELGLVRPGDLVYEFRRTPRPQGFAEAR